MKTNSGKVRKRKSTRCKRRKLRAVLKMLAVMESHPDSSHDPVSEFLVTGRTGRRNAMADILGPHATTSSGDLPERLRTLCTEDAESGPSTTGNQGQRESSKSENPCNEPGASAGIASNSAMSSDQMQQSENT